MARSYTPNASPRIKGAKLELFFFLMNIHYPHFLTTFTNNDFGPPLGFHQRIRFSRNSPLVSLSLVKYSAPSGPIATPAGRAQRLPSGN